MQLRRTIHIAKELRVPTINSIVRISFFPTQGVRLIDGGLGLHRSMVGVWYHSKFFCFVLCRPLCCSGSHLFRQCRFAQEEGRVGLSSFPLFTKRVDCLVACCLREDQSFLSLSFSSLGIVVA